MLRFKFLNVAAIVVGSAIVGFGVNYLNIANDLAEGGVTGIAVLAKFLFDWDPGITSFILNVPLLILGWKVLGKYSLAYTVWGTVCLSFFLWFFGAYRFPMDDPLLAALFAGVSVGVGLGIIFRFGGTTGGVDIVARVLHKYFGWKIGRTMFVADILVIGLSLIYLSVVQAMYTVVAVFVGTRIIDFVQEAAYSARSATIVSTEHEAVADRILKGMNRGVTVINGKGAYTGQERTLLYVVVGRSEIVRLKNLVLDVDPAAFISIGVANEVLGHGFTLNKSKETSGPMHRPAPQPSS